MNRQTKRRRGRRKRQQRRQLIIIASIVAIFFTQFIGYHTNSNDFSQSSAEIITTPKLSPTTLPSKRESLKDITTHTSTNSIDSSSSESINLETPKPTIEPTIKPTFNPAIDKNDTISYFSDCAFIGNSRTEGLQRNAGLKKSSFFTHRGLMVNTALTSNKIYFGNGKSGTLLTGLKQKKYKKIFLMFGVNELGWPYQSTFIDNYLKLIQAVQSVQPDAKIYVQSILPVTKEKSDSDSIFNNKRINSFNTAIQKMCEENKIAYIDLTQFAGNNVLPANAATDGIHLTREYCLKWIDTLRKQLD